LSQNKILLVDDNLDSLKVLNAIFSQWMPDKIIYQVNDGRKALNIARSAVPDIIITDWDMPFIDGLALIRQLKKDKATSEIPVIMATGVMISSEDLKTALQEGAVDYIRKPFDPAEVIARTHSALMIADFHKKTIEAKNVELTEHTLYLVRVNEFLNKISAHLEDLLTIISSSDSQSHDYILNLLQEINNKMRQDSWQKFGLSFDNVHRNFHKNLIARHPDLTPSELKLCALISLGMNNKNIASILYQNPDSVKVARSRLRGKLGLTSEQNLEAYLNSI